MPDNFETGDDVLLFENKRFLQLCSAGSNNAIEFLFSPQLEMTDTGKILYANREKLINQRIKFSFLGLAAKSYKLLEGLSKEELLERKNFKIVRHAYRIQDNLEQLLQTREMNVVMKNVEEIDQKILSWEPEKILQDLKNRERILEETETTLPQYSDLESINKISQEIYSSSWNL